jgi:hypothetical protein
MEDIIVQPSNDSNSLSTLYNSIIDYYYDAGRSVLIFEKTEPFSEQELNYFVRFLVDKKHVMEYRICTDRGISIAIPSLAIGPHFFSPGEFWDYENSQRFTLEPTVDGLKKNLKLMDEFFSIS